VTFAASERVNVATGVRGLGRRTVLGLTRSLETTGAVVSAGGTGVPAPPGGTPPGGTTTGGTTTGGGSTPVTRATLFESSSETQRVLFGPLVISRGLFVGSPPIVVTTPSVVTRASVPDANCATQ
jgi:hypothetical protein